MTTPHQKPLSPHATEVLSRVLRGPVPCREVNPGVVRKLVNDGYCELVDLPSPYATHHGQAVQHLKVCQETP